MSNLSLISHVFRTALQSTNTAFGHHPTNGRRPRSPRSSYPKIIQQEATLAYILVAPANQAPPSSATASPTFQHIFFRRTCSLSHHRISPDITFLLSHNPFPVPLIPATRNAATTFHSVLLPPRTWFSIRFRFPFGFRFRLCTQFRPSTSLLFLSILPSSSHFHLPSGSLVSRPVFRSNRRRRPRHGIYPRHFPLPYRLIMFATAQNR